VPSTSSLPSLTIGFRRAEVTAFWFMASVVSSAIVGTVTMAAGARAPWLWAAVGLCIGLPGLVWPLWFELGVRAWNKGATVFTAFLRGYVLKVSYYLLFGAVSRTGSSLGLQLGKGEVSRWIPRDRDHATAGDRSSVEVDLGTNRGSGRGWLAVMGSSRTTEKAWTVCLMPVMLLLLLLRDETQESAPPSSTYTLF
jgi:hypothetical protein